ncbi:MAG TPA: ABC transporter permease [Actinomycetota bacterium]|nr:ABC transporter permease [Actinomycetota bacterium]
MRAAVVIALKDLRRALRDRSALGVAVVAPLALAFVLSTVLGGGDLDALEVRLAFVDQDGGEQAEVFRREALGAVEEQGFLRVTDVASQEGRRLVAEDRVAAAIFLPPGFTENVTAGRNASIDVLASPQGAIGVDVARAVAEAYAARVDAVRLAVATIAFVEREPPDVDAVTAAALRPAVRLAAHTAGSREFEGNTFFAAGMTVFFLFFTAQFGAISLLRERREGTLARLLASPASRRAVLGGKGLYSYALGALSMATMVLATRVLMGSRWGDPAGVAIVIAAGVFAAMGIQSMVASLAKTDEQAAGYGSIVGVTLGLLGGTFFPLSQAPGLLSRLNAFTPHALMMRAFGELSGGLGGPADVIPEASLLILTGAAFGAIALLRADRLVGP